MSFSPAQCLSLPTELPFMSVADFEELSESTRKCAVEQLNRLWSTVTQKLYDYLALRAFDKTQHYPNHATTSSTTSSSFETLPKSLANGNQAFQMAESQLPSPSESQSNTPSAPGKVVCIDLC